MTDLVIAHLYPDLLRTYGDRDNVVALSKRAEWRGFSVRVVGVGLGVPLPRDTNVVVLGGGTDSVQEVVGREIASRKIEIRAAVERGAVVLGVCGGFQLLGTRYVLADGRVIPGMGALDVETRASAERIVGRVLGAARLWGQSFDVVGFENHGGRTTLGPAAEPFAVVPRGHGNNGRDRVEGASQGTVVGTYLHGPVLEVNPELTDALLARALAPITGGEPLALLDDSLERRAREQFARRVRDERKPSRGRRLVAAGVAAVLALSALGIAEAAEKSGDGDGRFASSTVTEVLHPGLIGPTR